MNHLRHDTPCNFRCAFQRLKVKPMQAGNTKAMFKPIIPAKYRSPWPCPWSLHWSVMFIPVYNLTSFESERLLSSSKTYISWCSARCVACNFSTISAAMSWRFSVADLREHRTNIAVCTQITVPNTKICKFYMMKVNFHREMWLIMC